MKIKAGFIIRKVLDSNFVLPVGSAVIDFNGMLKLNESGTILWHELEKGSDQDTLANALVSEYGISRKEALQDVRDFLCMLDNAGCLEN